MGQSKRNIYIDCIKFIMAIIVAFGHYGISGTIDGGFAVSVFFLISGYYLIAGIKKNNNKEKSIDFIRKKIVKLYPPYITVFILLLLYNVINKFYLQKMGNSEIINYILNSFQEVFLLQGFGFSKEQVNPTMWFFSVLLISILFIHILIHFNEKLAIKVIFPIIIIVSSPLFIGNFEPWGKIFGVLYIPLVKGFCTILLGMYSYFIAKWYNKISPKMVRYGIMMGSILACLYLGSKSCIYIGLIILILLPLYDTNLYIKPKMLRKCLLKLISLSDQIYFSHYLVITGLHAIITMLALKEIKGMAIIYIVIVLMISVILKWWCLIIQKWYSKIL